MTTMTGGCQCGRVRYSAEIEDDEAYLCHCRMCQRATGGVSIAFKNVPADTVAWHGEPDWYRSSPIARRPFCSACGTPFSRLLEEPPAETPIEPQTAAVWSMVFPGLGHWKLGRRGDAIARFAMFGWSFGALLVLLVSRFGKGGMGPTMPLFLLFLGASLAIYVLSAVDAYRIASGDQPIVGSRALLWTSAGLIVLSVLIATFVTLPAARR